MCFRLERTNILIPAGAKVPFPVVALKYSIVGHTDAGHKTANLSCQLFDHNVKYLLYLVCKRHAAQECRFRMSVESFDPGAQETELDDATVAALVGLAPAGDEVDLSTDDVERYAYAAKHDGWEARAAQLGDDEIKALIRLFTLGEERYPSWSAGAKSPVVPFVRELKQRGSYEVEWTRWIKAHTTNKFLPHGSLLDRL